VSTTSAATSTGDATDAGSSATGDVATATGDVTLASSVIGATAGVATDAPVDDAAGGAPVLDFRAAS
jgi:hypothetical protein